jgi:DNA-binding XRE family transcriptional regulator
VQINRFGVAHMSYLGHIIRGMSIYVMPQGGVGIPQWDLSDRLRKAREFAGYEQADLERLTGLSRATISNYERGRTKPSKASMNLWSLATGVSLNWLVNGESPDPQSGPGLSVRPEGFEPPTFCFVVRGEKASAYKPHLSLVA